MNQLQDKDSSIRDVVFRLRDQLGASVFDIVDNWGGDACAASLARPDNHKVLVYVATCGLPEHRYFAGFELPPVKDDLPYQAAGEFNNVDFAGLVNIIKQHFGIL